ncbi:MAG: metallophosphoesterase, partial [Candidatus Anstonellales archaeon]
MKFLALSDLHASEEALDRLRVIMMRENDYDWIFIVGDITTNGPVSYAEDLLDILREKGLFVHGNMDP